MKSGLGAGKRSDFIEYSGIWGQQSIALAGRESVDEMFQTVLV
jgi:hypothetical protein